MFSCSVIHIPIQFRNIIFEAEMNRILKLQFISNNYFLLEMQFLPFFYFCAANMKCYYNEKDCIKIKEFTTKLRLKNSPQNEQKENWKINVAQGFQEYWHSTYFSLLVCVCVCVSIFIKIFVLTFHKK